MSYVTVFRFRVYDPSAGRMRTSHLWGTRQAVECPGLAGAGIGTILEETGIDVDSMALDSEGLTSPGFDPLFNRSAGG